MGFDRYHTKSKASRKQHQESSPDRAPVAPGKQTFTERLPPSSSSSRHCEGPRREGPPEQAGPVRSAYTHDLLTLAAYDPVAALTDPEAAWGHLPELPTREFLRALEDIDSQGFRGILARHPAPGSREDAAMRLFDLAELEPGAASPAALAPIAQALACLGPEDQSLLINAFMRRRGIPYSYEQIAQALPVEPHKQPKPEPGEDSETLGDTANATPMAGATTPPDPIRPDPWEPGRQPPQLYIGNDLHNVIADIYKKANQGDDVFTNHTPLGSTLAWFAQKGFEVTPSALSRTDRASRPDILNLTRLCLYEIRPANDQKGARAQADLYIGLLQKGGVTVSLGPSGAKGTKGRIPAPGGVAVFRSPEPGVICYRYHPRAEFVPVPVPRTNEAPDSAPAWEWQLRPLKLALDSPTEEQAMALTIGATLLSILVAILLIPVSA